MKKKIKKKKIKMIIIVIIKNNNNYDNIVIDLGLFKENEELNKILNNTEKKENKELNLNLSKDKNIKDEFTLESGFISKTNKITKNNYDINEENKNKDQTIKNKIKKEDSTLSSINFNKKGLDSNNKNSNNILIKNNNNKTNNNKTNINKNKSKINNRPLSHSNSTQEIISAKNIINIRKYPKSKINNPNSNIQSQIRQPIKNQKMPQKYNSNIPSNSGINQKGNGTSININNYYTNDIFSAIYNNFIPHQIYSKFNNNNKKKVTRQRASSVIATKNKNNKNYLNKNKKNNQNKNNVNVNKTAHNNTLKKYRTNSTNQLNFKS